MSESRKVRLRELGKRIWCEIIVERLPKDGLSALRSAVLEKSPRLVQCVTVYPTLPPDSIPEKMCAIAFALNAAHGPFCSAELVDVYLDFARHLDLRIARKVRGGSLATFFYWYDRSDWNDVQKVLLETIERRLSISTKSSVTGE